MRVRPLAEFFERVRRELAFPEHSVTVRLISDPAMASLNGTFRGKRGPTDVLSFPARAGRAAPGRRTARRRKNVAGAADPSELAGSYIGDIAISPQTASRNARRSARTLQDELRILILHGMIHLAGYDHETDDGEMDRLEGRMRRRLNLASKFSASKKSHG